MTPACAFCCMVRWPSAFGSFGQRTPAFWHRNNIIRGLLWGMLEIQRIKRIICRAHAMSMHSSDSHGGWVPYQYRPVFSGTLVLGLLEFRGLGAGLGDIGSNQVKVSPSGGDNVAVRHLSAQNMLFSGSFFFPFGVPTCETKLQRERESTQRESSTPPAATLADQR